MGHEDNGTANSGGYIMKECPEKLKLQIDLEKRFTEERESSRKEITKLRDDNEHQHNRLWDYMGDVNERMLNVERGMYYGKDRMKPPRKKKVRKIPTGSRRDDNTMVEIPNPLSREPVRIHTDRKTATFIIAMLLILFTLLTGAGVGLAMGIMG